MDRLRADQAIEHVDLNAALDPRLYVGRCPEQVDEFVADIVTPIRRRYREALNQNIELHV